MATLSAVIAQLEEIAPLGHAESWDNVGLLVEPTDDPTVERVLLTIDLSPAVLREACQGSAELVIAYHPVIFRGLKRLRCSVPAERLVVEAIARGIAVYSPHTALDAAEGGMNDWLVGALGAGITRPVLPAPNRPAVGMGRIRELAVPLSLAEALARIKTYLGISVVRVATAERHAGGEPIRTIAACAGAGGSVFEHVGDVDLLLTGEMRHHDILDRLARGTSVIVTDHTNTERGYLPVLKAQLTLRLPGVRFWTSSEDRDPLTVA